MQKTIHLLAYLLLPLALLAWTGVVLFAWHIGARETEHADALTLAQQSSTQHDSSVRIHAFVQESAPARAKLDSILEIDIVSVANMIASAGKAAGVNVKLSGALPEQAPLPKPGGPQLQAVGFSVQADGKFAALMRAAELFETLPIPASLTRIDIQHTPDSGGKKTDSWHINLYLIVFTTSNVSS